MHLTSTFDVRQSRDSLDRKLTILKSKINVLDSKSSFPSFISRKNYQDSLTKIYSEYETDSKKNADSSHINHFAHKKSLGFVKLFINQLKRNAVSLKGEHPVCSSRMTREIEKLYNISYQSEETGVKGIKPRNEIELTVSLLTVIAILTLHFLSTFQCLFTDFREEYSSLPVAKALKFACLFFTLVKIVISLTVSTVLMGKRIEYISQIAYNYVTDVDFYLDLLVLLTAALLLSLPHSEYAGVFGFCVTIMNVVYIGRLEEAIDVHFITNSVKKQVFQLFKLLLANFYLVHFLASLLIGLVLIESARNWMDRYGITDEVWWIKYIYGLYWSASIIATVGFGDIVVNNYGEAMVLTIIILLGCLVLSYNIAQVSSIIHILASAPNQVRHQLSVLRRFAAISKIDENLHHAIGEYLVNSAEIKKSFEIKERLELIQMLPSQMREEFIEQSSRNFCTSLPFFFMLENETKRLACEKMEIQVLSPNQYITHKRLGLTKIYILRKGVIGLAYKKKGSRLNGVILDNITIQHEKDDPQLLNTYLLIRGRKLTYDIICQEYCVVSYLSFQDFYEALKESERDFELYHQCRDETQFKINEWDKKKCQYCEVRHSLFVCPKMHYIPLRSQTFLKSQKDVYSRQKRPIFKYERRKPMLAQYTTRKLWKKLFVHVETAFETKVQKSQTLRMTKIASMDEDSPKESFENKTTKALFEQYLSKYNEKISEFYLDTLKDYKYYFNKSNPSKLAEIVMRKDFFPIVIERIRSV